MIGYFLAFLAAVFDSFRVVFSKFALKDESPFLVAVALRFFAAFFAFPFLLIFGFPELGNGFFTVLILASSLNALATFLYMSAIKYSDISLSMPLLSFVPAFLLITSPLILGQFPSFLGIVGVLLISFGGFFLLYEGLTLKNKGVFFMLGVVLIYSITANFDKIGISLSSPLCWMVSVSFLSSLFLSPFLLKEKVKFEKVNIFALFSIGVFSFLTLFAQLSSLNYILVPYAISLKRLSVLFSVFYGWLFFKEKRAIKRFPFALLMFLGAVLLALS